MSTPGCTTTTCRQSSTRGLRVQTWSSIASRHHAGELERARDSGRASGRARAPPSRSAAAAPAPRACRRPVRSPLQLEGAAHARRSLLIETARTRPWSSAAVASAFRLRQPLAGPRRERRASAPESIHPLELRHRFRDAIQVGERSAQPIARGDVLGGERHRPLESLRRARIVTPREQRLALGHEDVGRRGRGPRRGRRGVAPACGGQREEQRGGSEDGARVERPRGASSGGRRLQPRDGAGQVGARGRLEDGELRGEEEPRAGRGSGGAAAPGLPATPPPSGSDTPRAPGSRSGRSPPAPRPGWRDPRPPRSARRARRAGRHGAWPG